MLADIVDRTCTNNTAANPTNSGSTHRLDVAADGALVLVVAMVNIANMLSVGGLARRREMAVRAALGASRGPQAALSIEFEDMHIVQGSVRAEFVGRACPLVRSHNSRPPCDLPTPDR